MARTVKDTNLGTRNARLALPVRKNLYLRAIIPGLHIGYYRGRKNGSWVARRFVGKKGPGSPYEETKIGIADDILDADGVTVLSFAEAQEKARNWFSSRAKADASGVIDLGELMTVGDVLDEYVQDYKRRGGKAADRLQSTIDAHIKPSLGEIRLHKLTRKQIEAWVDGLVEKPPRLRTKKGETQRHKEPDQSPDAVRRRRASANRILTALKAALNLAYYQQKVPTKLAWESVKPFREADAAKIRFLDEAEIKRLTNACSSPFKELVTAALLTGARYGELSAMTAGDFELTGGTIYIPRSKSGKARHIHLSDEGKRFFKNAVAGKTSGQILFLRSDGEPWKHAQQARFMKDACTAAKISPAIGFHILRHSYASRLAMRGVPMQVIAAQLGHSDTRMTEKHYAHLAPSHISMIVREQFGSLGIVPKGNIRALL